MNPLMKYPVFVTEQVLTAKNLNDIVDYLNEQNLSTRRNLIGIGIVCGLEVSSDFKKTVNISCGCGVTSLGHLINIPEQELLYYRKYIDAASEPYDTFILNNNKQVTLWELLTEEEYKQADDPVNDKPIENSTAFDLKKMAVLLYLEVINKDLDNCIDEGCDEKGIVRLFNLRKLLISKSDLLKILVKDKEPISTSKTLVDDVFLSKNDKPECYLEAIKPHRLNCKLSDLTSLNLSDIQNWSKLKDTYLNIIEIDAIKIGSALYQSYELFKDELVNLYSAGNPFSGFESTSVSSNQLSVQIKNEIDKDEHNIQYAYDLLCDLVKAYDEFCETAAIYQSKCCVDTSLFPYHLMLGLLLKQDKKTDHIYRHYWQPSPAVSNMNTVLNKLRLMHYKMVQMVENFILRTFSNLNDIVITPGKFSGWPFSEHSMAHFYNDGTTSAIQKYWSYELSKMCREDTVLSYFASQYSLKPFVLNPLLYNLHNYEYFRIEGHIGQEYKSVLGKIRQLTTDYNLPFDVLGIKLSTDHLDVEVEDNCFNDIQTVYRCNRDEYLACEGLLSKLIDAFLIAINVLLKKNPQLLDRRIYITQNQVPFINALRQMYTILNIYSIFLKRMQELLPEHVKDFDFPRFRIIHFVVWAFTLVGKIILEYVANLLEQNLIPFAQITLLKILFERMIDDCMEAKFESIYTMYRDRLLKLQLGRLFPGYVDGSPGMEHIAGVKEGGTFILVYDEIPEEEPEIPPERPEPGKEEDPCLEDEESKQLYLNVLYYAYVFTKEPVVLYEMEGIADTKGNVEDVKEDLDSTRTNAREAASDSGNVTESANTDTGFAKAQTEKAEFTKANYTVNRVTELKQQYTTAKEFFEFLFGKDETEQIPKKKYQVVADFAVPFRCCSSCLQVEEIPAPEISISIDRKEFCKNERRRYPIIVSPEGGEVESSAGGLISEEVSGETHYYFIPYNTTGDEEIILTYTYNEVSVQTIVHVYNPKADFDVNRITDPDGVERYLFFENKSTNADQYEWKVKELDYTSNEQNIRFRIDELPDSIEVTLTAFKGNCRNSKTETIVVRDNQDVQFDVQKPKYNPRLYRYCNNDEIHYPFTALPEGEEVTGDDGVVSDADGNYFFAPLGLSEGTHTYYYRGRELSVYVIGVPEVKFEYDILEVDDKNNIARVFFVYEDEIISEINWNFGDSTSPVYTTEHDIIHTFDLSSGQMQFEVRLIVYNQTGCSSIYTEVIDFSNYYSGGYGFYIDPDRYGSISLREYSNDELNSRLEDYNYSANVKLLESFDGLVERINTDEATRESFLSGKMNSEIAEEYQAAFLETRDVMVKVHESEDQELTGYLTNLYIGEFQLLLALVSRLNKDPGKTSALYKVFTEAEEYFKEMMEMGININPDGNLKSLFDKSIPRLRIKTNVSEVLNNIAVLI